MKTFIKKNFALLFVICILLISVGYLFQTNRAISKSYEDNVKESSDTIKNYKDKYGRAVSEKRTAVLSSSNLKTLSDSLRNVIKGYKPVIIVQTEIKYVHDSIFIPYDVEIPCVFTRKWDYKDKWLHIGGLSTNKGVSVNDIVVLNKQDLVIGDKRDGFLKPRYFSVKIVNTNTDMQVTGLDSYIIKRKKTIFDRWYFWAGVGLFGGMYIAK